MIVFYRIYHPLTIRNIAVRCCKVAVFRAADVSARGEARKTREKQSFCAHGKEAALHRVTSLNAGYVGFYGGIGTLTAKSNRGEQRIHSGKDNECQNDHRPAEPPWRHVDNIEILERVGRLTGFELRARPEQDNVENKRGRFKVQDVFDEGRVRHIKIGQHAAVSDKLDDVGRDEEERAEHQRES